MIIKSITLKNFRQYRDKVTINFSSDGGKSVTVFTGDNGHGKSTLIQAFIWTIYNQESLDLKFPKDILNKDTLHNMHLRDVEDVFVEIVLTHGGVEYTFLRQQTYTCIDPNKARLSDDIYSVWYTEGGEKIRATQPISIREKILPEDLAGYFFFDGEHIKKLNEKRNLKQSIAKLLGLLPLQNAVRDLDKVAMAININLPKDGNEKLTAASANVRGIEAALESQKSQKDKLEVAFNYAKSDFESAQQDLANIKLTSKLIEDRKNQLENLRRKTELSESRIISCSDIFNSVFFNILSSSLIKDCSEVMTKIEEENLASDAIPNMNVDSIKYILEKGKCICGADLSEHPELIEHIKQLASILPPHSIGTEVSAFIKELDLRLESASKDVNSFSNAYDSYYVVLKDVDNIQSQITELDIQLQGVDDIAVGKIRERYKENEKKMNDCQKQLSDVESNIKMFSRDLNNVKSEIDRIISLDEKYNRPRICSMYVSQLVKDIDHTRLIKESSMLDEFTDVLNEVFSAMYHGERKVDVDDNYNVHLFVPNVGETAASEGTESVLGFAYVCSLLKLALKQMDDPELATEPHALIMDAPTSTQDERHTANVFKYTITVADQVILFINHKDWQYVKPVIDSKIDRVYELNKISEIVTKIDVIQ